MEQRIEAEQDLAAQRATLQSTLAAINELTEQRSAAHLEAQRSTSQALENWKRESAHFARNCSRRRPSPVSNR
jgi:hypothetical protein